MLKENGISSRIEGKEGTCFGYEKKGTSLFHKQIEERNKKELGPQLLSSCYRYLLQALDLVLGENHLGS